MILATVAWGIILVELVSQPWAYGPSALSLRSTARPPFELLGITIRWDTIGALATAGVLAGALALFLKRTTAGRALRAVGESSHTAALMGIDIERTFALAAGISGFLGGVAGLLIGYFFSAGIATGSIGVKALAAAVIGGFGNVQGAVLGGCCSASSTAWSRRTSRHVARRDRLRPDHRRPADPGGPAAAEAHLCPRLSRQRADSRPCGARTPAASRVGR